MNYDAITLTPEQAKLFNKLKNAYKACEKAGIKFVNVYGTIQAYDKALVDDFANKGAVMNPDDDDVFPAEEIYTPYRFRSSDSFADDDHYIRLTPKGMKLLESEE